MSTSIRSPVLLVVLSALLLALCLSSVTSAPSPALWRHVGRANDLSAPIRLTIGIKQRNVPTLLRTLTAVSSPSSPTYRQHLSFSDLNRLMAPTAASVASVTQWLTAAGIPSSAIQRTVNGEWLSVDTTVQMAESLLSTQYHLYRHTQVDAQVLRCDSYTLPADVRDAIDVIGPTTRFPAYHTPSARHLPDLTRKAGGAGKAGVYSVDGEEANAAPAPPSADPCSPYSITPACIRAAYGLGNTSVTGNTSTGAVNGFLEEYISVKDLDTFFTKFDSSQVGRRPTIIGPNDASSPGVEASLDIQYMMALAHGANVTFWYTAGRQPKNPENEPFLVWLMNLANSTAPPLVISTSYGDDEPSVDFDYGTRCNTEFAKAGARGISILFSSGDGGVAGGQSQRCTTFIPTYPAGSPYVTAVGGTRLISGVPLNETSAGFSSGGFSNYWPRPDWQKQAVDDYFNKYGSKFPNSTLFNQTGRGIPDVAAVAENFPIVVSGQTFDVDGTSCSSPTFAAFVVVLNDLLLAAGQDPLGFLNPLGPTQ